MRSSSSGFFKKASVFIQEVHSETKKVTWPSRRETLLTTLIVFVFAIIAAIFFTLVDHFVYKLLQFVIG